MVNSQELNYSFKHLWVEDGLSQSTVFSIYKDQKDFMWFGTRRGLNRFDGVSFNHYMHNINDTNSISDNLIYFIIGDKKDNLLIQTSNSIEYFDRYKDRFYVIPFRELFWNYIKDSDNNIWACSASGLYKFNEITLLFDTIENQYPFIGLYDLVFDNNNTLWITSQNGVIHYNPFTKKREYYNLESQLKDLQRNFFIEISEDKKVWICFRNGYVLYYNANNDRFVEYEHNQDFENIIVSSFSKGLNNTILIGTDGNGLIEVSPETKKWKQINHVPDLKNSLSSNTIYSIYADDEFGILWLGSYMGGIDYTSLYSKGFNFLFHQPYKNSLINNNIRSLLADNTNKLWIGTRQGITVYNLQNKYIQQFSEKELGEFSITNPIITKIWQDNKGYIWICSYKGGIVLYDNIKQWFVPVEKVYPKIQLPHDLGVFDILQDSKNNFWFATESGTYLFPENKTGFIFHEDFSKKIIEDRAGRIFIGTVNYGLLGTNSNTLKLTSPLPDTLRGADKIKRINTIYSDSKGNIWAGTGGAGLILYNPTLDQTFLFTANDGLPDNNIAGIIEDRNGIIWVTTYSGLARLLPDKKKFKNIYFEEGIKGKEFNPNSMVISSDGIIYAGSINGLLYFNPDKFWENPFIPEVVFTDIFINNKKIDVAQDNSVIDNMIMFVHNIDLKYNQNTIGLEFTAPEYYFGEKVSFYYKLSNIEKEWIYIGNQRFLNLVGLKPGEYNLSIKAANSDGYMKNEGTSLLIHINQPPWLTVYAYILYLLLLLFIILFVRKVIKTRVRLKYQIILEKAEKEKQAEINQTRIKFFTDISHEIGTSLTLINLPLETLNRFETDDIKKHYLSIINSNIKRLMQLVRRIITLRRIETGNLPLNAEKDDIILFLKSVCGSFSSLAQKKKIKFIQSFPFPTLITWFDKEKLEHIIFNLLSNAFKFEPEDGKVCISLSKQNGTIHGESKRILTISVNNEGSTIPDDKAAKIFTRFYKGDESTFGSGIGLSLSKYYVDIHRGEINFDSGKDKGVTFNVNLPFGESFLKPEEKNKTSKEYQLKTIQYVNNEHESEIHMPVEVEHKTGEKELILYIEDDMELRKLLHQQLSKQYKFIEANDGEEGLMKAKNFQPDLVISDIKMQNMNGLDLCRALKNEVDTSHIPVILLTAMEDIEEQIEGLDAGADAYITKPFSVKYLNSVIRNLLESRKKLKRIYNASAEINPNSISFSTMDEKFLEKAYRILEENISNSNFGIPQFIDIMGITKYMLYKKIKVLTGQTPNDFIVNYRLKKAAFILKEKNISDLDLYIQVGFNDISYFRKCFKKFYGVTPNQYMKSIHLLKDGN
ncbi:MAG: response regulator [Bacteroidales bacterium]|nr:response regulator [Bacteroidales bacterium]